MPRPTLVVDASVAVKWILPEEGHEPALRIQERYQDEEIDLIAPYLLVAEVANVLWKRERRGDLTALAAQRCFQQFLRDSPLLWDSAAVSASALALASAHARPVYDCLYLAWALEQRCDLVTADERFFHAMGTAFPCVKVLGACEW
jgi:predicted nucleic acid-binding protein